MTTALRSVGQARAGLAIMTIGMVGVTIGMMTWATIPQENREILLLLIGSLVGNSGQIIGYYFSTSRRSGA